MCLDHLYVCGDTAVGEMTSDPIARNGTPFRNRYCWVVRFDGQCIVEVRAYLDSALVAQVIEANEKAAA